MRNIAWGIPEYNQFGTGEFLHFCKLIGAKPQIALNLGSGTPAEAASWVRYVDRHWDRHSGLLWELGNELWGDWNLGYPTLQQLPARTLAFSRAVHSVDPSARLIATGQDPDYFEKWNAAQLTNPPGTFRFLSTHFVVGTDSVVAKNQVPDAVDAAAFALPVGLGRKLEQMQAQINQTPGYRNRAHIAFTEWLFVCCSGHKPAEAPRFDNMGGAIGAGGFLNMLLRHSDIVPVSDMTGIVEVAGIWERRGAVFASPAYYAFRMYSTADPIRTLAVTNDSGTYNVRNGVKRLPDIANVPYLDVVATRDGDGKLTLLCVNRDLQRDISADISIEHFAASSEAHVQELSAENISEGNDEAHPHRVAPASSAVMLNGGHLRFTFRHASVARIDIGAR